MAWLWGSRVRLIRADAQASLAVSHQQFEDAVKGREEAVVIGDQLRDIRAKNNFAATIEFHLRGAQHA